jgi:hypothetical protein
MLHDFKKLLTSARRGWEVTQATLKRLGRGLARVSLYPLDAYYTRAAAVIQGLFLLACLIYFRFWSPAPVGVAIGCLGFAAAIMAVRTEHYKSGEKALWILIAFGLFAVELQAIYRDQDAHDRERTNEDKQFEEVLKTNQDEFDRTLKEMRGLAGLSSKAIAVSSSALKQLTGNGQFCYLQAALPSVNANGKEMFPIFVFNSGSVPLDVCHAVIQETTAGKTSTEYYWKKGVIFDKELGPLAPGKVISLDGTIGIRAGISLAEGTYYIQIRCPSPKLYPRRKWFEFPFATKRKNPAQQ